MCVSWAWTSTPSGTATLSRWDGCSRAWRAPDFRLLLISTRGTVAYPESRADIDTVGWWRCRFVAAEEGGSVDDAAILALLARVAEHVPWMHVQKLRFYGEEEGFTRAQGQ